MRAGKPLQVYLYPEEHAKLLRIAEFYGGNLSLTVRQLINRFHLAHEKTMKPAKTRVIGQIRWSGPDAPEG